MIENHMYFKDFIIKTIQFINAILDIILYRVHHIMLVTDAELNYWNILREIDVTCYVLAVCKP